jgi:hypothetical protein
MVPSVRFGGVYLFNIVDKDKKPVPPEFYTTITGGDSYNNIFALRNRLREDALISRTVGTHVDVPKVDNQFTEKYDWLVKTNTIPQIEEGRFKNLWLQDDMNGYHASGFQKLQENLETARKKAFGSSPISSVRKFLGSKFHIQKLSGPEKEYLEALRRIKQALVEYLGSAQQKTLVVEPTRDEIKYTVQ